MPPNGHRSTFIHQYTEKYQSSSKAANKQLYISDQQCLTIVRQKKKIIIISLTVERKEKKIQNEHRRTTGSKLLYFMNLAARKLHRWNSTMWVEPINVNEKNEINIIIKNEMKALTPAPEQPRWTY